MSSRDLGGARWIILPSTSNFDAWRVEIHNAVVAAGLRFQVADLHDATIATADDDLIVLTSDASLATANAAREIVIVLPDPQAEASATGSPDISHEAYLHRVRQASQRLAEASSLPSPARILDCATLHGLQGPLNLFADVSVNPPAPAKPSFSSDLEKGLASALALYDHIAAPRSDQSFPWLPSAFDYGTGATPMADGTRFIDLTGRPRFLVFGPYIAMPIGRWTARARFSINEEGIGRQFRLDWGTQSEWSEQMFKTDRPGIFEMELTYDWKAPAPSEIRLVIMEGCFSGEAAFMGAEIRRAD